jgi:hypothetical protein
MVVSIQKRTPEVYTSSDGAADFFTQSFSLAQNEPKEEAKPSRFSLSRQLTETPLPQAHVLMDWSYQACAQSIIREVQKIRDEIREDLSRFEARLAQMRIGQQDHPLERLPRKDSYSASEVAKEVQRSEYQVRKWCRDGRLAGRKSASGEWLVAFEELVRYKNEGLRPVT